MSVSKLKLTVAAVAITAIPVVWQWNEQREAREASAKTEARVAGAQNEFTSLQMEIEKLRGTSEQLNASLADAENVASLNAEKSQKFSTWKEQLRARLLSPDYQWPEESPFVRIPKSVVPRLKINDPISPDGIINQNERELLGLTPQERERMENALQTHFDRINELITAQIYETNASQLINIPTTAIESKVWSIPALGEVAKMSGEELQSDWKNILGVERWPLMQEQLASHGSHTPSRILGLGADRNRQDLAVWLDEQNGIISVEYGWAGTAMFTSGGAVLDWFLPGAVPPLEFGPIDNFVESSGLPVALTRPAMDWIRQQAATRLGGKGAQ